MKNNIILLLLVLSFFSVHAQVNDDFSDNNFTQNPTWIGDDSLFQITGGQLRLKGTQSSEAHLVTPHVLMDSVTWLFYTRFALNPSSQNFSRFYLSSSSANLELPLNGYYVQLGGSTGTTDTISLYKQEGTSHTRIISGRPATVGKTNNLVGIKVFRDKQGNWELYSDTTGGVNYQLEGAVLDTSFLTSAYLGWYIKFTSGNSQNYYLDNVWANAIAQDTSAPSIDSVVATNSNTLVVYFNEDIDTTSAIQPGNYIVSPQNILPNNCTLVTTKTVQLTFTTPFTPNILHTLTVSNIADRSGNTISNKSASFNYNIIFPTDILISEFFPDPTPVVGLPEIEFIELYNNTALPINIKGVQITDGTSTAVLPTYILEADSFLIVCPSASVTAFTPFGNTLGVNGFPSLNNSSDVIALIAATGDTIHTISYTTDWYNDASKKDGGWTIEMISPKELCKGKNNYTASIHSSGGTPGKKNSVWKSVIDTSAPKLISAQIIDSISVKFSFDKALHQQVLQQIYIDVIPFNSVATIQLVDEKTLLVILLSAMQNKNEYTFLLDSIADCLGNTYSGTKKLQYLIGEAESNYDVLINEIMANPNTSTGMPNAEYIELYNRSTKPIQLKNWKIADASGFAVLPEYLLLPDSFLTLTSNTNAPFFSNNVVGVTSFPSLSNDGELLVLYNAIGQVIHLVSYTSMWHENALKKSGGWSLEMIDAKNPCGLNNWKSCINTNGGTPGKTNSVKDNNKDNSKPELLRAYTMDSTHLQVFFTESMDSTSFSNLSNYVFSPDNSVTNISSGDPAYQYLIAELNKPIAKDELYKIQINNLTDCAGNTLSENMVLDFGLPIQADSGNLVINEILFNPVSNGVDFVELYNNSFHTIDLNNLYVSHLDDLKNIDDTRLISTNAYMLLPNEYIVLSSNPELIKQQYYCLNKNAFINTPLTSMPDDVGNIAITTNSSKIIDAVFYDKSMHLSLLSDQNGVSLERINPSRSAMDKSNWTSAAASKGYATPTYKNSNYLNTEIAENTFELQPKTISPDGDGYQDVMNINYNFDEDGYIGTLTIFDASGRSVKSLFKNHIMGKTGTYTWNGTLNDGGRAPNGIYIFYLDVYTTGGKTKQYKTVGVVAQKF